MSISKKLKQKFVLSALGIVLSCFIALSSQPVGAMTGYAADINVNDLSSLSNQERANAGLAPLTLNTQLSNAALAKANDMFADNYWAHVAPDGLTPWSFILAAGYKYASAGENLAKEYNTSSGVVAGWMASPTHKANVLSTSYVDVGYAVVNGNLLGVDTSLVVAMYGSKSAPVAATTAAAEPTPTTTTVTKTDSAKSSVPSVKVDNKETATPAPTVTTQSAPVAKAEVLSASTEKPVVKKQEPNGLSSLIYNMYTAIMNIYVFLKDHLKIILGIIAATLSLFIGFEYLTNKQTRRRYSQI